MKFGGHWPHSRKISRARIQRAVRPRAKKIVPAIAGRSAYRFRQFASGLMSNVVRTPFANASGYLSARSPRNYVGRGSLSFTRHAQNFKSIRRAISKRQSTHGTLYRRGPAVLAQSVCDSRRTVAYTRFSRHLARMCRLSRGTSVPNFIRI